MTRVWDVPVHDSTRVRDVRVAAEAAAEHTGLSRDRTAVAALVATELATNLLKHGGGGQILIDMVDADLALPGTGRGPALQIAAIDHGPGIADLTSASRDGFSATASLGAGLGTCRRIADHFEVHSVPGQGTVALARVHAARRDRAGHRVPEAAPRCGRRDQHPAGRRRPLRRRLGLRPRRRPRHAAPRGRARPRRGRREGVRGGRGAPAPVRPPASGGTARATAHGAARHPGSGGRGGAARPGHRPPRLRGDRQHRGPPADRGHLAAAAVPPGHRGRAPAARLPQCRVPWTSDSLLVLHSDGLPSRWAPPAVGPPTAWDPAVTAAVIVRDSSSAARPVRDDTTVAVLTPTPQDRRP